MARPVARWELRLAEPGRAEDAGQLPMFLRIARAIADDARRGRLSAGAPLPGSRELSSSLGVHRNTVLAAYRELAAEGFLETERGRGTFIARSLPTTMPRRWRGGQAPVAGMRCERPGFDFEPAHTAPPLPTLAPRTLLLYGGLPDTRLLPHAAFARAYRRALLARNDLLTYGDPSGEPRLRAALAQMLRATRGLAIAADDVLITRGSQMSLSLLGRVLVRPGDRIAVEAFGYQPAWRALSQHAGVTLVPIAVDAEGLVVDALEAAHREHPVRAVYVTPHHQYPTTVTMSATRRMQLLALAERLRIAIIEDDYDHEFHYEGRPVLPLASADRAGNVCYIGTLSKSVAPGLRVGYLIAPRPVQEAALAARFDIDRQGDRVSERALAELMEDGELQRHLWRARRVYRARRDYFVKHMRRVLGERVTFEVPPGGMAVWARVSSELDVAAWHARALEHGVAFQPGRQFHWTSFAAATAGLSRVRPRAATQHARFGYAWLPERELGTAIERLKKAADEVSR